MCVVPHFLYRSRDGLVGYDAALTQLIPHFLYRSRDGLVGYDAALTQLRSRVRFPVFVSDFFFWSFPVFVSVSFIFWSFYLQHVKFLLNTSTFMSDNGRAINRDDSRSAMDIDAPTTTRLQVAHEHMP